MKPSSPLFDTHAHLSDEVLAAQLDQVIERAGEQGIVGMLAVGTTVESSRACVEIASRHSNVWAAVGIHPNYCGEAGPDDWDEIVRLTREPKVVAIGETGLDRHWDHTPWPAQLDYLQRHVHLSTDTRLPLVIHMRDCETEMLEALSSSAEPRPLLGIMHSFTGSAEGAASFVELGLHISFAGMVTYPKSGTLRTVAASIPIHRLLVETDSPYLSPHPVRGHRPNEPSLLVHTARCIAECRGAVFSELATATTLNARKLFGLG